MTNWDGDANTECGYFSLSASAAVKTLSPGQGPFGGMQNGHSYLLGGSWAGSSSMGSSQRHSMCCLTIFCRLMIWTERGLAKMRDRGEGERNSGGEKKLPVSTLCFPLEIQTCCVCLPRLPWLWGRDYEINNGTTGTIHETAAMTTVGSFPRAPWETQRKTLHCTAKIFVRLKPW